jgi:hypothetical protein
MSLTTLLADVAARLEAELEPTPELVGAVVPVEAAELPAVVVEVGEVSEQVQGVGRLPAQGATGALPVVDEIDLANPTLVFPDGAANLLGEDRLTLFVPHGPVVRRDGTTEPPFEEADFTVTVDDVGRPVVDALPSGDEVQLLAEVGELRFAAPLPPTGTVRLTYHVGLWQVRTVRYQGVLTVTIHGGNATVVGGLSEQVEQVLSRPGAGVLRASPLRLGSIAPASTPPDTVSRTADFRIDHERIDPLLSTGGGVITEIDVPGPPPLEPFVVRRRSTV